MDPSRCSVVISYYPAARPFTIDGNNDIATDSSPEYLNDLQQVFGQVILRTNAADAVEETRQLSKHTPTLLLLDLDTATPDMIADNDDLDDDDTVYTPSCSSSCSSASWTTPTSARIRKISRDLDAPVIACSSNDNPSFMLDCVHAGAADYVVKPLRMDVIKTLFLKLHRCRPDLKMHDATHGSSSSDNVLSTVSTLCPEDDDMQQRIKDIFNRDVRFTKSVMDIYANPLVVPPRPKYRGLPSERALALKHKVSSWDFSPFDLSHDDLIHCTCMIFEQVLLLPDLAYMSISQDQLYDFITDLSNAYLDANPYHNFAHAVDVLQCLYYFLCQLGLLPLIDRASHATQPEMHPKPQDLLRPNDIFALLIAAIGHDAGHPGVNNLFLINSAAPLALLYNDRSVLESFHSMTLFQIIKKHGFDQIGGGPGSSGYQAFRKTVVTSILATDMSLHADYVKQINSHAFRISGSENDNENGRLLLCSALIKCADISNVTRPFLRAAKWAELLVQESVCQGDLERTLGLPSLPLNDREKVVLEDSQIGFIRFVALELFENVREILPEMSFTVDCIRENLIRWENRKNATHDSGVASLGEEEEEEEEILKAKGEITVEAGSKRRSNSLDYHAQAVEVLRKRLSLDTSHKEDGGEFTKLPTMPTVALQSYDGHHGQHHHAEHHEYPGGDGPSPVYCQCTIQ
ncbi:hypothetical protein BCR43DRAFT_493863 [Syncephalastrum racemosum]|uniref:PDEase domain-containing protein n=1 Tax=Syncephalastrum racemosum TaxID=13706 RepID=A0A1X2HBB2_SYNRA|nr:hypothetical protein BCR43DRAFT_493863 [Syncephalastrum racemosum]